MNYTDALNYIHNTLKFGIKLGLQNIETLLDLMDNPHKKLKFVHVAGTNGKGSTVAFISSVLIAAGFKVGIYTSPYLERFTERIKINNFEIPEEHLARLTEFVKSKVEIMIGRGENHPTEFEIVTAIAFRYFYESGCDVVVLEVGLGGRFDSTNVIDTPLVSVITSINYDHMDRLGSTLPKIAFEKAGIIKDNGDVVIYPQCEEVEQVFYDISKIRNSTIMKADFGSIDSIEGGIEGQVFNYKDYKALKISLLGEHQVKNAVVAVETLELLKNKGFTITEYAVREGLKNTRWPGRLEIVNNNPLFLIDGAHNAEGACALTSALKIYFPNKKIIFIIGVLKDKDFKSVVEAVTPISCQFIAVTPNSDRAMPAEELAIFIKLYCKNVIFSDTIESAIKTGLDKATPEHIICAFGSLYYIGEIRKFFGKNN